MIPTQPHKAFPPHQRRYKIKYSRAIYDDLLRAHHSEGKRDEILPIALQFQFGVMLAYEVIHALVSAAEGKLHTEPFLFDAIISEMGFETEKRWFGGHLELMFQTDCSEDSTLDRRQPVRLHRFSDHGGLSELAGVFVLMEYPYRGIITSYELSCSYMGVRNKQSLANSDLGWRISTVWIARLLQKAVWRRIDDPNDVLDTLAPSW